MATTLTEAQICTKLDELRDALHEVNKAPTKATTGDDSYDNTGKAKELMESIAMWSDELDKLRRAGCGVRGRRRV